MELSESICDWIIFDFKSELFSIWFWKITFLNFDQCRNGKKSFAKCFSLFWWLICCKELLIRNMESDPKNNPNAIEFQFWIDNDYLIELNLFQELVHNVKSVRTASILLPLFLINSNKKSWVRKDQISNSTLKANVVRRQTGSAVELSSIKSRKLEKC